MVKVAVAVLSPAAAALKVMEFTGWAPLYLSARLDVDCVNDVWVNAVAPVVSGSLNVTVSGFPFASTYEPTMIFPSASSTLSDVAIDAFGVPAVTAFGAIERDSDAAIPAIVTSMVLAVLAT